MTNKTDVETRWYIVHTYSSQEERVKKNLDLRIENMDIGDKIFQVIVPTEEEIEIKGGRRLSTTRRIYPGYLIVEMKMDEESWYVVRNTPGVTGFVSADEDDEGRPSPVPLESDEVQAIMQQIKSDSPRVRVGFEVGQTIRITEGPFTDFMGAVEEVDPDRSKVKVLVSFFGRETPVELDFLQIEKA